MISFIKGTVVAIDATSVVVESNNIGYEIVASAKCLSDLSVGEEIRIHTLLAVREDSITLYGFKDVAERDMFTRLTTVTGIGPKLAVTILSGIDAQSLISCIATQDVSLLNGIKGVGKKTAERILLELKGKIKSESAILFDGIATAAVNDDEAILALMALGYSNSEAVSALARIGDRANMTVEEAVMAALRG